MFKHFCILHILWSYGLRDEHSMKKKDRTLSLLAHEEQRDSTVFFKQLLANVRESARQLSLPANPPEVV